VVVVCVLFVSLFCLYVSRETQINESLAMSRYDRFLLAFMFVYLAERCGFGNFGSPWCMVAADFQTLSKKERRKRKQMKFFMMC
jgi:hypothetical protein